jgi:rRNA pseudouridine-1189 N-methylase Emg1 (Nep1/Mra1 family)
LFAQVYIHTTKNVLIEVSPQVRIPRTFKRFSGLMVQLLHKLKIRAANSTETLLRVVKNPISRHLPPGGRVFGMSVEVLEHTLESDNSLLVAGIVNVMHSCNRNWCEQAAQRKATWFALCAWSSSTVALRPAAVLQYANIFTKPTRTHMHALTLHCSLFIARKHCETD